MMSLSSPDDALFPALIQWENLADAGYGPNAASPEGRDLVAVAERRALTDLFKALGGPSWRRPFRAKWATSASHCSWAGVTCLREGSAAGASNGAWGDTSPAVPEVGVVAIHLRGAGLSGSLPASLASLQALQMLVLADNAELRGMIPRGLLALPRLRVVSLRGCKLGGVLPKDLSVSLVWLDVSSNQLGGELPVRLLASLCP